MPTAYLLLGANLGNRAAALHQAAQTLAATAGPVVAASALYETAAWGLADQPAYLNQALALQTSLPPTELLTVCLAAEQQAGRVRQRRWDARTLDVDILLYDDLVLDLPDLQIPHPRLPERRFALTPLAEIAPALWHPTRQQSVAALLARCPDALPVRRQPDDYL